jgi:8-oxo-dGTP pyrophosphatase MutT (NUDIX family)
MFQVPIPITGTSGPAAPNRRARMVGILLPPESAIIPCVSKLIEGLAARMTLGEARPPEDRRRRAAVAVVLHDAPSPRVLLMKRAERAGDPWSGHISLPGGGYHVSDGDLRVTAIRETREELGIDLEGTRILGKLEALQPRSSGPTGIEVTPFVFATQVALEPICGPEALAAFWLPLDLAASGALDGTYTYPASSMTFPSWTYEGHVIWGLTHRILTLVIS